MARAIGEKPANAVSWLVSFLLRHTIGLLKFAATFVAAPLLGLLAVFALQRASLTPQEPLDIVHARVQKFVNDDIRSGGRLTSVTLSYMQEAGYDYRNGKLIKLEPLADKLARIKENVMSQNEPQRDVQTHKFEMER